MADIPFINRAQVDQATGVIVASEDTPDDTWAFLGAIAFAPDTMAMAVTTSSPPADTDTLNEGISITPAGQVHVWDFDSLGLPSTGVFYVGGIPLSGLGEVIITADAVIGWVGGWPIAANSYVVMNTGGTPPPPEQTFNKIVLTNPGFAADSEPGIAMAQLYFGTSGTVAGFYTDKTTFLSDHPGLTLYDFPGGGPACTPLLTVSISSPGITITVQNADTTQTGLYSSDCDSYPFNDLDALLQPSNPGHVSITVDFDPPVNSAGFNYETRIVLHPAWQIDYYDGVTLLLTETGASAPPKLTTFAGYSTATGAATNLYENEAGDGQYLLEDGTNFYEQE